MVTQSSIPNEVITLTKEGEFYKGLTISGELGSFGKFCGFMQELETMHNKFCINICSTGGGLHDGLAFAGRIACSPSHITTIAYGLVASSATLPYIVGKHRLISRFAYLMLHEASVDTDGSLKATSDFIKHVEGVDEQYLKWLAKYSNKPYGYWKKLVIPGREIYLNADECIELGLADEII
jgi:ATP-dependent protease ClpP protease subunit